MINSFEALFITISFIIPGFIVDMVYRSVIPQKTENFNYLIIRYIYFSCINFSLSFFIIYLLLRYNLMDNRPLAASLLILLILLIIPVFLGFLLAVIDSRQVFSKIFRKLGLAKISPVPTAWDYKFSNSKSEFLIITLLDNSTICGYLGQQSFISSDSSERDIYISHIYKIDKAGNWTLVDKTDGMLIKQDQIKTIEFRKG